MLINITAYLGHTGRAIVLAALMLTCQLVFAQQSSELSADLPSADTMQVQDKVDGLFDSGEFERAYFIYRKELAPSGDKYAQYMVGYMLQKGLGVDEDAIAASAWYRLAAERDTREFVAVRDQLLRTMTDDERRQSDDQYRALRVDYSDLAVLLASIKRDVADLEAASGSSRIYSPSAFQELTSSFNVSGSARYRSIYRRLQARIELMKVQGRFDGLEFDPEKLNLLELERAVNERIVSGD
jgi:TPR repeat protein